MAILLHDAAAVVPDLKVLLELDPVAVNELDLIAQGEAECVYALSAVLPRVVVAWVELEDLNG